MQNKKSKFGDLYTFKVSIDGKNMTELVMNCSIFQDLFNPFWSVELMLLDTMTHSHSFKAGSEVEIVLETRQGYDTDGKSTITTYIHEISDREQNGQQSVMLIIRSASKGFIESSKTRIKRLFEDTQDKIVQKIVQEGLECSVADKPPEPSQHKSESGYRNSDGSREKSKADDTIQWICPNILPLDAISTMMRSARYNGKADFVFFTKDSGMFSFESLSNMFNRKPVAKFIQRPAGLTEHGNAKFNQNLAFHHFVIHPFNNIQLNNSGYQGLSNATFDFIKKEWNIDEDGEYKGSNIFFTPKHKNFESSNLLEKMDECYKSRRKDLFNAEKNKLIIQTPGHCKAVHWLGETCEIDVPNANSSEISPTLDKKYEGKYLIVGIGHIITPQLYSVNLELVNGWDK